MHEIVKFAEAFILGIVVGLTMMEPSRIKAGCLAVMITLVIMVWRWL